MADLQALNPDVVSGNQDTNMQVLLLFENMQDICKIFSYALSYMYTCRIMYVRCHHAGIMYYHICIHVTLYM